MIVTEKVVDVDALGRQKRAVLQVADRELEVLVAAIVDHQALLAGFELVEDAGELLGLDLTEVDVLDDDEPAFLDEERERALQRTDAHAPRRAERPVLRPRRMGESATDEDRGALAAVAGLTGALLFVDLLLRTAD